MRAFVFTDTALESEAGRFVWLEVNTERPQNAAFVSQLKVQALPTYFILDPRTERVLARRVGGATTGQFREFLDAGRAAFAATALSPAETFAARAESLYAAGDLPGAIEAYEAALGADDPAWTGVGRTVEALLFALYSADRHEEAARLALARYPELRRTPAAANVAASGLVGALSLPGDDPRRAALVESLLVLTREVVNDPSIPVTADDRSGAFGILVDGEKDLGDTTRARRTAQEWARFLEGEAARARTPEERTVFDSHRLSAYLELEQPERAVEMLLASERDLPDDYNPPARLAVAYLRMKRYPDALAASDRAVAKAYGPRKLRVLQNHADILAAMADTAGARQALVDALALAESLPEGQRSERTIASLRKKLGG